MPGTSRKVLNDQATDMGKSPLEGKQLRETRSYGTATISETIGAISGATNKKKWKPQYTKATG